MAEPLKATFFAFRKREKGGVLLGASVAFAVLAGALWGLFLFLNQAALGGGLTWFLELARMREASGGVVRPEEIPDLPPGLLPMVGGLLLVLLAYNILLAAYEAACLRWMIHGKTEGVLGLSLGADTWRVWGIYWVWFGLNIGLQLATALMVGAIALGMGQNWSPDAKDWIELAIQLVFFCFMVRLAPAAATSVGRGAFSFFAAWTITRDRFWALLGSFLILGLIMLLCYVVVFAGAGALMWPSIGPDIMALIGDPQNRKAAFAFVNKLFSGQNVMIIGGAYLAMIPAIMFALVTYYGICSRAVLAALDEGKIERESAG